MPTLLVKGSQHPLDPLPGPAKDGTKTVPTPYMQCWYVQMTLVGIKMPTLLVKGSQHSLDPLPGPAKDGTKTVPTPCIQCWYVKMTLVDIKMTTLLNETYEGMVVHRKYSGYSAVTFRWIKLTC